MSRNRRPLRSISLNLKEGDSIDELRTAYLSKADAVTHELEDHCPDRFKAVARKNIRQVIDEHGMEKPTLVRVSTTDNPNLLADLEAIVSENLYGIMLPKVRDEEDILKADYLLTLMEKRAGLEVGRICIMPLPETAQGHRRAYHIVDASERVEYMVSATNTNGDPARSIGYQWTRECTETLYIRQKVVLDTRAAGMQWPVCCNWNAMDDREGLENYLIQNRQIGYFGSICSPEPSYIDTVNRIFTPPQDEIDSWGEIVALQEQYDDDVKIDGKWYARNRSKWGRLRLDLAAAYGVYPRPDRPKMKVEQVGGIMKAAEAEAIGNAGMTGD
ncbi:aldolase/citrate lyase family protein [Sphingobium subterraneum]|uniref:Citrate lyase subunit beta/citryl-CoA lyase n=1 Tax=Sphingobium subterraneum TaxID=627688 RepID=A0A841IWQ6_9SPHN|nr:citrate lyase subunit beta/citryl-CoA lyase [Sphingobium subterraneum]